MRIRKLDENTKKNILEDLLQRSPNQYPEYEKRVAAILDAVKAVGIPTVEVHISDVSKREDFRQVSFVRKACVKTICGHGIEGYIEAIDFLRNYEAI